MKVLACAAATMAAFLSCAPAKAELNSCTEITALPFTITVQGVYCLKQNLNVNLSADGSAAITINAGNVTIDFNGFRVNNQAPLATTQAHGVLARNRKNITLRNGFIRGFSGGIWLDETTPAGAASHLVEEMKIADSGGAGIQVDGEKSVVRDNRVLTTGGGQLSVAFGIVLEGAYDGLVTGNIISGLFGSYANYGIFVRTSNRVKVTGNEIGDLDGGSFDRAIVLESADHVIVAQNRLLNNPGTGTDGIVDNFGSDNLVCYNNESAGFTATPYFSCNFSDGNRQSFN